MKHPSKLAGVALAGLIASISAAEAKSLFVYVSPNPIGVNDFLKLGKVGTERVAKALGGRCQDLREHRSDHAAPEPRGRRQGRREDRRRHRLRVQRHAARGRRRLSQREVPAGRQLSVRQDEAEHLLLGVPRIRGELPDRRRGGADHARPARSARSARSISPSCTATPTASSTAPSTSSRTSRSRRRSGSAAIIRSPIPARGQERAAAMVADGADRILAAGAGSNGGIFKAMQDAPGANAFGVDVNQCPQAPGVVMDNVEKKTDVAVELAVKGIVGGYAAADHRARPQRGRHGARPPSATTSRIPSARSPTIPTRSPR